MSYQKAGHFQGNSPQGILLEMVEISKKEKNINYTYKLHCNLKHTSGLCIQIAMAPPSSLWFYSAASQLTESAETPTASWSTVLTSFPARKRQFHIKALQLRYEEQPLVGNCELLAEFLRRKRQTWGGQLLLCRCDGRLQISAGKLSY